MERFGLKDCFERISISTPIISFDALSSSTTLGKTCSDSTMAESPRAGRLSRPPHRHTVSSFSSGASFSEPSGPEDCVSLEYVYNGSDGCLWVIEIRVERNVHPAGRSVMIFREIRSLKCRALCVTSGTPCRTAQAAIQASLVAMELPFRCCSATTRP